MITKLREDDEDENETYQSLRYLNCLQWSLHPPRRARADEHQHLLPCRHTLTAVKPHPHLLYLQKVLSSTLQTLLALPNSTFRSLRLTIDTYPYHYMSLIIMCYTMTIRPELATEIRGISRP